MTCLGTVSHLKTLATWHWQRGQHPLVVSVHGPSKQHSTQLELATLLLLLSDCVFVGTENGPKVLMHIRQPSEHLVVSPVLWFLLCYQTSASNINSPIHQLTHSSTHIPIHPYIHPATHLSSYPCTYTSTHPSIQPPTHLSISPSTHPPSCPTFVACQSAADTNALYLQKLHLVSH